MKKGILLGFLFLTSMNLFAQNWSKISKKIKREQFSIIPLERQYIDSYYDLRKNSKYLNLFSPITPNDTIFIIESFGDWSSLRLESITWNESDTIVCVSSDAGKTFSFNENMFFTKRIIKLISEWDIEGIKKEEELNSDMIPQYTNFVSRIIFKDGKYEIRCIYFKDFFNLERDRLDFRY